MAKRPTVLQTRYIPGPAGDRCGLFSKIVTPSGLQLYGGELPWRNDAKDLSCLPPAPTAGNVERWLMQYQFSSRHGRKLYHVVKRLMPDGTWGPLPDGRTVPEWHSGNLCGDVALGALSQVLGCTILGNAIVTFKARDLFFKCADGVNRQLAQDQLGVSSSGDALARFEADMEQQDFELEVRQGTEVLS